MTNGSSVRGREASPGVSEPAGASPTGREPGKIRACSAPTTNGGVAIDCSLKELFFRADVAYGELSYEDRVLGLQREGDRVFVWLGSGRHLQLGSDARACQDMACEWRRANFQDLQGLRLA